MNYLSQKWLLELLAKVTHPKSFLNQISEDPMKAHGQKVTIGSYEIPIAN